MAAQAVAFEEKLKGIEDERVRLEAVEKARKGKELKDKLINAVEKTVHSNEKDKLQQNEVKEGILKQFKEMELLTSANEALTLELKEKTDEMMIQEAQLRARNEEFIKQEIETIAQLDSIKNSNLEIDNLKKLNEELRVDIEGIRDEGVTLRKNLTETKQTVENYELLQKKVEDDLKISEGLKNYEIVKSYDGVAEQLKLKEKEIEGVVASMIELTEKHRLEIQRFDSLYVF